MKIAAIAHRIPSRQVDNAELVRLVLDRNAGRYDEAGLSRLGERLQEYFLQTGVRSRFWRGEGEKAVTLGLEAGAKALQEAGVRPEDVDLLLYVGVGRGWIEPAMANLFLAELGLSKATGFDVVDACASWLRALDIAAGFIQTGRARKVLILNCECNVEEHCDFVVPDMQSLEYLLPGCTIGEAVTATLITDETPQAEYRALFRTWGAYHGLCRIPLPNQDQYRLRTEDGRHEAHKFYAYGTRLIRVTMRKLVDTYRADPYFRALRPDICFGHFVSEAVTTEGERLLGLRPGLTYRSGSRYGNTVSASLPLAMSLAVQDGSLRRGQTVLFLVGSAGISVGLGALTF